MKEKLLFIVGPTASGKTALAVSEAVRRNAVILSCDSLCFYRHMDIGTAKPTESEQATVPHYGIDLVNPDEPYSVSRYIAYCNALLKRLSTNRQSVIVVGGSGFYLKSFFEPVVDDIEVSAEVMKRVQTIRQKSGLAGLLEMLDGCNPSDETFTGLDRNNPRRVEKALIRCMCTGQSYSELREEFFSLPKPFPEFEKEVWLIQRSIDELKQRNRSRINSMLEMGLVDEVKTLRGMGFERNPSACTAIGYREVLDYLDGRIREDQLTEMIYNHTNQLMRKQRAWFRRQIPVNRELTSTWNYC